jgi:hypothetical protein
MEKKYYYKVVCVNNNKLYSASYSWISKPYLKDIIDSIVIYEIGKWTIPHIENSKLFVFKTKKAAQIFYKKQSLNKNFKFNIYKVEVENPLIFQLFYAYDEQGNISLYHSWNNAHMLNCQTPPKYYLFEQYLQEGTIFVDKIKLVERIR